MNICSYVFIFEGACVKNRKVKFDEREYEELADFFSLFGDRARLKILAALMQGEVRVKDLAESVEMTQSAVSHQLRVLKQARVVRTRRDGKNMFYSLDDSHIADILSYGMEHILEV